MRLQRPSVRLSNQRCANAPTRFTLRLLTNAMAERFPVGRDTFGFALLPVNGGFGMLANVFSERAREMGSGAESQGITLGDLMAHELGHLLLGTSEHSVAGIMRARWQARELQGILRPAMFFFPEQADTIRAQVRARMAGMRTPTV